MTDLPGLDLARFTAWFNGACPGEIVAPVHAQLVAGGRSNLTYEVSDGHRSWMVRRPPLGHVLATAHDMTREYRVITALRDTGVPVPLTYALCTDADVLGAPFYVMSKVEGTPYRTADQLAVVGPARARVIAERLVATLAQLHAVVPAEVGLSDFGRPDGFLARQVRRWKKQLDASRSRPLAGIDELYERLAANPPDAPAAGDPSAGGSSAGGSSAAIVHGDYRLDNVLVNVDDKIAAVVDWEMATLGDPLTDVGLLVVYQRMDRLAEGPMASDAPGYPDVPEVLALYAAASGRDLANLGFYVALASFKLAVILEGIHYRYVHGQTVGEGFEEIGTLVEPLITSGLAAIMEDS
jgi:aminoglycoside phosphotransferase (APT) family kinase protein